MKQLLFSGGSGKQSAQGEVSIVSGQSNYDIDCGFRPSCVSYIITRSNRFTINAQIGDVGRSGTKASSQIFYNESYITITDSGFVLTKMTSELDGGTAVWFACE